MFDLNRSWHLIILKRWSILPLFPNYPPNNIKVEASMSEVPTMKIKDTSFIIDPINLRVYVLTVPNDYFTTTLVPLPTSLQHLVMFFSKFYLLVVLGWRWRVCNTSFVLHDSLNHYTRNISNSSSIKKMLAIFYSNEEGNFLQIEN